MLLHLIPIKEIHFLEKLILEHLDYIQIISHNKLVRLYIMIEQGTMKRNGYKMLMLGMRQFAINYNE